jgi:hypothetical protein
MAPNPGFQGVLRLPGMRISAFFEEFFRKLKGNNFKRSLIFLLTFFYGLV